MRKKLLIIIFWLVVIYNANAQEMIGDHDITIGYGILPAIQVFRGTEFYLTWGTFTSYNNKYVTGEYFIKYQYHIGKRLSIGLYGGQERESGDWIYIERNGGRPSDFEFFTLGTFSRTSWTVAPELNLYYYNSKNISVYSTIGISKEFVMETGTYNMNNHQDSIIKNNVSYSSMYFSPFGIKFGGRLSGNFEVGMGYKGIFNCGVTYKFLRSKKV